MNSYFEYYGRMLNSVQGINRMLSGRFDLSKCYLQEINPYNLKSGQTFTEKSMLIIASRKLHLPENMLPLSR